MRAKLDNLRALTDRNPGVEVFIYSDASTDGTNDMLRGLVAPFHVVLGEARKGKSSGINRLMSDVAADIVVFNDANVMIGLKSFDHLAVHFAEPDVGLVNGHITRSMGETGAGAAGTKYYDLEQRLKRLETELDTTVIADGSLYAIRRSLFRLLPAEAMEDAFTSTSILCDGYRLVHAPDLCGMERYDIAVDQEMRRRRRVACRAFRNHMAFWPCLRRMSALRLYMYISHKVLRWLSFGLAVAGCATLLGGLAFTWPIPAAILTLAMTAMLTKLIVSPSERRLEPVGAAFAWTFIGVLDALRGRQYVTWTPERR